MATATLGDLIGSRVNVSWTSAAAIGPDFYAAHMPFRVAAVEHGLMALESRTGKVAWFSIGVIAQIEPAD